MSRKIRVSKKVYFAGLCVTLLFMSVISIIGSTMTYAGGGAGARPGSVPSGTTTCNKYHNSPWWDHCGGYAWRVSEIDGAHSYCIKYGATQVYRLVPLRYTGWGYSPNIVGWKDKDIQTNVVASNGGYRPYFGISWGDAKSKYDAARPHMDAESSPWETTGSFCWNPDWANDDIIEPEVPSGDDETIYGEGTFWADSYITVSNEVATHEAHITTKDKPETDSVTIKVSTDSSATVKFSHTMSYDDELWDPTAYTSPRTDHPTKSTDEFDEITTKLKIQQYGVDDGSKKDEDFGTGKSGAKSGQKVLENSVSVSPDPGETLSVCQVLTHQSIKYIIKGEDTGDTATSHGKWEFEKYNEDNDIGITVLCAEVYKPEDPTGDDPHVWAKEYKGENDGKPMFVGETSNIGWHTMADWEGARRVRGWQAIAFTVPSNVSYSRDKVTGDLGGRGTADPCNFYRKAGWGPNDTWCSVIGGRSASGDLGESGSHRYDEKETIALQDYVGYKYCNSFGYYWEYWYSIAYNDQDNWAPEGKTYWTNYNAACRTIAKKPSTAYYNSGVLTNGGIKTSLSPRLLGVGAARTASGGDFDILYGSWPEYLAVVGGSPQGFASGSTLSRGSSKSAGGGHDIYPRSPLTISNDSEGSLGHSGISTNATLRTRLATYLRSRPAGSDLAGGDLGGTLGGLNINDGRSYIYTRSGDLNITGNITISDGAYPSIYQIPQVVIFVDGNVNISGNVTRIDAWIIATEKINTCSDFRDRETQTASVVYSSNTVCDKQLTLNGPVIAKKAELNRSYGSDPVIQGGRYVPGEIFNLNGGNYLWAYAQAGRYNSSYTEGYSRELAPRY